MDGKIIRELRESRSWSQVTLAKQLGVTKQCISNWENGNIQPSVDALVRLADVFDVSTDYLIGHDNKKIIDFADVSMKDAAFINQMIKYIQELNRLKADKDK